MCFYSTEVIFPRKALYLKICKDTNISWKKSLKRQSVGPSKWFPLAHRGKQEWESHWPVLPAAHGVRTLARLPAALRAQHYIRALVCPTELVITQPFHPNLLQGSRACPGWLIPLPDAPLPVLSLRSRQLVLCSWSVAGSERTWCCCIWAMWPVVGEKQLQAVWSTRPSFVSC